MPTIQFDGVIDNATGEYDLSPTFVAGDVTISVAGGAFTNTTNLPSIAASGAPVCNLVLTDAEFVSSAIIRVIDQNDEWAGPTLYGVASSNSVILTAVNSLIAAGAVTNNPVVDATTIELINGDTYDGSSAIYPKLTWATTADYTIADEIKLVFHDKSDVDVVLLEAAAVASTSVLIECSLTATFTPALTFIGYPLAIELGFALVAITGTAEKTIARGICRVLERGEPT